MTLKQKIYNYYLGVINDKIKLFQKVLADLKESGSNETKSTAGDKHETALAMLQIEQANVRTQLQEASEQKLPRKKINPAVTAMKIVNASVTFPSKEKLFLGKELEK